MGRGGLALSALVSLNGVAMGQTAAPAAPPRLAAHGSALPSTGEAAPAPALRPIPRAPDRILSTRVVVTTTGATAAEAPGPTSRPVSTPGPSLHLPPAGALAQPAHPRPRAQVEAAATLRASPRAAGAAPPEVAGDASTSITASPDARDPWARPFFVKGELESFSVRPLTRRNFVGIGAGVNALPGDANSVLNAFYLTVEPQFDVANPAYKWRLGLGAPLQFELLDTRGAFEICVNEGRGVRHAGGGQLDVASRTGQCVLTQKGRVTEGFGQLRHADWDEASDFAKVIRYFTIGRREDPFYLSVSRLYDQTFGHGTVVRHYNPNIDYNTARLGATMDFNRSAVGVQAMANDVINPDVLGLLGFVRPLRPYSDNVFLRSLSLGASWVHGPGQPRGLQYELGLFGFAFDQAIPRIDQGLNHAGARFRNVTIVGVDLEGKVVRTNNADLKLYLDQQKMLDYGSGTTFGALGRFSFGEPARHALRVRAEATTFSADYMPSYFDTYHDVFMNQYLPAAHHGTNGLRYYPTKLEFLEASRGGRRRVGGFGELTYAFFDRLTLGASLRAWVPVGQPSVAGFGGPRFTDYGSACTEGERGAFSCEGAIELDREPGFGAVRFHVELPFRKFLQAFASYEMFTTTAEQRLGLFKLDGDNEVLFSGARLAILPILFLQAEARRYFFLQRVNNVNLEALTLEQDQSFHAQWTFAVNAFVGYEF